MIILASTFERVQIIPGAIHNYVRISALDCSTDTGKIAAAYEEKICIFEPVPVISNENAHPSHGLEYKYVLILIKSRFLIFNNATYQL